MLAGHDEVMDQAGSIAVSGMQAASLRLDAAASNIVKANTGAALPAGGAQSQPPVGGVSTSPQLLAYDPAVAELVNLKQAANDFRASLVAYKASSQMFKNLLDATA